MLTNKDIDECLVRAELEVRDAVRDAMEDFYRPDMEMEAEILWASLPDTIKRLVKERAPEAVKRIERK